MPTVMKDYLFQASALPLSIIIVGIGDADFEGMMQACYFTYDLHYLHYSPVTAVCRSRRMLLDCLYQSKF